MSSLARTTRSRGRPGLVCWLAGLALLSFCGCAANGSSSGSGSGGEDAGANSDGPPDAAVGSGGGTVAGSGGSSGTGSGGRASGSGGSSSASSGGAVGSGGSSSGGGSTGSGSGGTTGGGGVTQPHCSLSIQPVSPGSFSDIEAGTTVRLQGSASEFPTMSLHWSWTVSGPPNTMPAIAKSLSSDGSLMEFPVSTSGRYMITAGVTGDPNCGSTTQTIMAATPQGPTFTFRVTADGFPIQDTRVKLADGLSGTFQLDPGKTFSIKPFDPSNGAMRGSYVRISRPDKAFEIEGDTTLMPVLATLLSTQPYDLLIAPLDATVSFAPFILSSSLPVNWSAQGFPIDLGTQVSGQTLTAAGAPIQNARMQLRGPAPSTIGFSDAGGALTLLTRDGMMSAIVVPPDGSGLPVATTADASIASTNDASLSLTMQWAAMAHGTLSVEVRDADGTTPIANTQVRLSSSGGPYAAGKLTVSSPNAGDVVLTPDASVADSLQTDASGTVTFPSYPAGTYTITAVPPAAAAPAAVTTVSVILAAGTTTQIISLARKVSLTGTLSPPGIAKVTAIDVGNACTGTDACPSSTTAAGTSAATGVVVSGQAADSGTFTLAVDPDRTYQIIIQPGGTSGRAILPSFRVCSTATAPCTKANGGSVGTIPLPMGMQYQGVLSGRNNPVAGAFVQVFCAPSSASCADPTVSLAEATSLGDGTFSLILPAPATMTAALNK